MNRPDDATIASGSDREIDKGRTTLDLAEENELFKELIKRR
jgi:hypothetical protein